MISLPPLRLADGSRDAVFATTVELAYDDAGLEVVFTCEDEDAWSSFERRDDPLWQEEVVEVFLAVGTADPALYYEVEVSPRGVLFDAQVFNPHSRRDDMVVDTAWDWAGIAVEVEKLPRRQDWRARLFLPWQGLGLSAPPPCLRTNFYRVERPRRGAAEFSCWSPTFTSPPDFHKPARFGTLVLGELATPEPLARPLARPLPGPLVRVPRRDRG